MLPTPPRSSHSGNKENKPNPLSTRVVAWAQHNQIHTLSLSPPKLSRTPSSAFKDRPRSILKKQSLTSFGQLPQDICDEFKPREITPEPQDPLCDLKYLENPVSCIISSKSPLKDLIEAYSVLAARIRCSISGQKGETADASWPLFQPLRTHRNVFVKSLVRDLGKALMDPLADEPYMEMNEDRILALLPSPNNTPRKKKDGMTAEQVKYARDLCTISHSVIKFLNVVWTTPAVCGVFSDEEHIEVLSQVLAIPLAQELPTINARKTCTLAIWLIQTQRLPKDVLGPTANRIAAALKRAIDGELGKEGKKGSVNDGLRAIHDLCVYQPMVFVKPFVPILPTILQNLLAPTLALRVQACQALGGIVTGANKAFIRKAHVHARFARLVRFFLTRAPSKNKEGVTGAALVPSTPKEPAIIRTLRITLEATDPQHSAQGPVWALNVIANFIVLLGPILIEDSPLRRTLSSLLSLGLQHPKSSVRALACVVWRPFMWTYFQPPFTFDVVGEDRTDSLNKLDDDDPCLNEEEKEGRKKARKAEREKEREKEITAGRKSLWRLLTSVVECQMGVMTIAALLSSSNLCGDVEDDTECISDSDDAIKRIFSLLKLMILKGGQNCAEAIEVARRLVRFDQVSSSSPKAESDVQMVWRMNMFLPRSLFSATSNLLTVEFKSLSTAVRAIMDRSAGLEVVKSLAREELAKSWVFDGLIEVWREAVACLEMYDGDEAPTDISEVWDGLVKARVGHLQDSGDDAATVVFTLKAATILIDIIQDRNIDLTPKATIPPASIPAPKTEIEVLSVTLSSDPPQEYPEPAKGFTNGALKLRVIRDLWGSVRAVVPHSLLGRASERLLSCLVKNEDELLGGGDVLDFEAERDEDALKLWSQLSAELAMCCDLAVVRPFWGCERRAEFSWSRGSSRILVWRTFADLWNDEASCTCESSVVLLCAPFLDPSTESASVGDMPMWESLLDTTIAKALDNGYDSSSVLEDIASTFLDAFDWEGIPCTPAFIRATDILLSRFDIDSAIPIPLFRLVNDVLYAAYPPSNQAKQYVRWVLRTLSDLLRRYDGSESEDSRTEAQADLVSVVVTVVKQSVSVWITDEENAVSDDEWAYDMEPLYGYLLSALSLLPRTVDTLNDHVGILESAVLGNKFRTELAADAFTAFWAAYPDALERHQWPEGIFRCLASSRHAKTEATVVEGELPPSSPTTVVNASDSDEDDSDSSTLSPPSTPSKQPVQQITKTVTSSFFSRAPFPACSPSSPSRDATRSKEGNSRKKRRICNENQKGLPADDVFGAANPKITSFPSLISTQSKRKLDRELELHGGGGHPSPSKKSRASIANDSEDEVEIAISILASPGSGEAVLSNPATVRTRKRVTMIMEAVEIPCTKYKATNYRSSLRRTQSIDLVEKWPIAQSLLSSSGASMSKIARPKTEKLENGASQPKRKRRHSAESDYEDLFGPSPLPSLLATCKRSVTMPSVSTSSMDSSPTSFTPSSTGSHRHKPNGTDLRIDMPSSPSPRRQLALRYLVNDSDNEDDQQDQSSSPLRAMVRRKSRPIRS